MTSDNRIHKKFCETYKRLHLDYVYAYQEIKTAIYVDLSLVLLSNKQPNETGK